MKQPTRISYQSPLWSIPCTISFQIWDSNFNSKGSCTITHFYADLVFSTTNQPT